MTKQKFLNGLREALAGEISAREINNQLLYYERYINEQMSMGKKEKCVIEELGDPRLIAKTIISAQSGENAESQKYYDSKQEFTQSTPMPSSWNEKFNSMLKVACVILGILLVLVIIFSMVRILLPIVIPVILIGIIISLFRKQ